MMSRLRSSPGFPFQLGQTADPISPDTVLGFSCGRPLLYLGYLQSREFGRGMDLAESGLDRV